MDHFMFFVRSVGTFARALDCSSSVKQPSLHMSAAAASRDITQVFECTICTFFTHLYISFTLETLHKCPFLSVATTTN